MQLERLVLLGCLLQGARQQGHGHPWQGEGGPGAVVLQPSDLPALLLKQCGQEVIILHSK